MKSNSLVRIMIGGLLVIGHSPAQIASQPISSSPAVFSIAQLPPDLRYLAAAMGTRLQTPGTERMTVTGALTQAGKSVPVTITYQLPNSFRIDEGGSKPRSLGFNGSSSWASDNNLSETDLNLIESLLDDASETLLYSMIHGTSYRVLAYTARMDDGKTPNYTGPFAAIYQLMGRPSSQPSQGLRVKHCFFDSKTHLPITVRYPITKGGTSVFVETARANWTTTANQSTFGTLTRSENGTVVFTLQTATTSFSSSANDGFFLQP